MSLYWKNVTGASLALFVDFMAFYVLDYCLQGRFWSYGWKVLPFKRDTKYFTDYMSETFPPFVTCEVSVHLLAYVFFFCPGILGCRIVILAVLALTRFFFRVEK